MSDVVSRCKALFGKLHFRMEGAKDKNARMHRIVIKRIRRTLEESIHDFEVVAFARHPPTPDRQMERHFLQVSFCHCFFLLRKYASNLPSNPQRRTLQVAKMRQAIASLYICIVYRTFIPLRVRNTNKQTIFFICRPQESECPEREVICPYCQLSQKAKDQKEHEGYCGSRYSHYYKK